MGIIFFAAVLFFVIGPIAIAMAVYLWLGILWAFGVLAMAIEWLIWRICHA